MVVKLVATRLLLPALAGATLLEEPAAPHLVGRRRTRAGPVRLGAERAHEERGASDAEMSSTARALWAGLDMLAQEAVLLNRAAQEPALLEDKDDAEVDDGDDDAEGADDATQRMGRGRDDRAPFVAASRAALGEAHAELSRAAFEREHAAPNQLRFGLWAAGEREHHQVKDSKLKVLLQLVTLLRHRSPPGNLFGGVLVSFVFAFAFAIGLFLAASCIMGDDPEPPQKPSRTSGCQAALDHLAAGGSDTAARWRAPAASALGQAPAASPQPRAPTPRSSSPGAVATQTPWQSWQVHQPGGSGTEWSTPSPVTPKSGQMERSPTPPIGWPPGSGPIVPSSGHLPPRQPAPAAPPQRAASASLVKPPTSLESLPGERSRKTSWSTMESVRAIDGGPRGTQGATPQTAPRVPPGRGAAATPSPPPSFAPPQPHGRPGRTGLVAAPQVVAPPLGLPARRETAAPPGALVGPGDAEGLERESTPRTWEPDMSPRSRFFAQHRERWVSGATPRELAGAIHRQHTHASPRQLAASSPRSPVGVMSLYKSQGGQQGGQDCSPTACAAQSSIESLTPASPRRGSRIRQAGFVGPQAWAEQSAAYSQRNVAR